MQALAWVLTLYLTSVKLFVISVSTGNNQFTDSVSIFILVALLITAILQASYPKFRASYVIAAFSNFPTLLSHVFFAVTRVFATLARSLGLLLEHKPKTLLVHGGGAYFLRHIHLYGFD
jgi:hypothetical protein